MVSININFSNKWFYTLIVVGIVIFAGVGVYAYAGLNGVGHNLNEIQPCVAGQILQTNSIGDSWECVAMPVVSPSVPASPSPWTTIGSEIYYSGYVGVGVTNPSMKLHVANNLGTCTGTGKCSKYIAAFNQNPSNQNSGPQILIGYRAKGTSITEGYIKSGNNYPLIIGTTGNPTALYMKNSGTMYGIFSSSSDIRLKKNINELSNSLDKLKQIRGVSFEWNEKYGELGKNTYGKQIGVIAQEVAKVFPELVSPGEENYLAVDYGKMSAVLIEAIKEQQIQIEELQKELDDLKNN